MNRLFLAMVATALVAAACGSGEIVATSTVPPGSTTPPGGAAQLDELASARQLWADAPDDYTVSASGETLAVRSDEVLSLGSGDAPTIEDVFGTIERSIRSGAVVDVEYDETLGFPTRVVIDLDGNGVPDVDLTFSDLEAMPIIETRDELLAARAAWEAQGLTTHRYIFRADCTCPDGGTFDVEVRDGHVTRFVPLDTAAETSQLTPTSMAVAFDDLEEWFTNSADLLDEGILDVWCQAGPGAGYPRWFRVEAGAIDGGPFEGPFTVVVTIDLVLPFVPIDDEVDETPPDEDKQALLAAQALWDETGAQDYRYLLELHCECPLSVSGPFDVTVRGGEIWSTVGPLYGTGPLPDTVMIDDLFEVIAVSVDAGIDVDVTYDDTFGYPLLAIVDTEAVAVDGGLAFSITDFEPIDKLGFILGTVVAGPQCPVQQDPPQPGCEDRPVAQAQIIITGNALGGVPIPVTTGREGGFFIGLESGDYVAAAQPVEGYLGTPDPVKITVRGGVQEDIAFQYDTGIR